MSDIVWIPTELLGKRKPVNIDLSNVPPEVLKHWSGKKINKDLYERRVITSNGERKSS